MHSQPTTFQARASFFLHTTIFAAMLLCAPATRAQTLRLEQRPQRSENPAPHSTQNFALSGFSVLQLAQSIAVTIP